MSEAALIFTVIFIAIAGGAYVLVEALLSPDPEHEDWPA